MTDSLDRRASSDPEDVQGTTERYCHAAALAAIGVAAAAALYFIAIFVIARVH